MQVQTSTSAVTPGVKDSIDIEATVSITYQSTAVFGNGLWQLAMYGSKNADGSGERFQQVDQTLPLTDQDKDLDHPTTNIRFLDAYGEIDLSAIGCGEYRFLCFDFMKGENVTQDFNFISLQQPDSSKFTVCKEQPCSEPTGLLNSKLCQSYRMIYGV